MTLRQPQSVKFARRLEWGPKRAVRPAPSCTARGACASRSPRPPARWSWAQGSAQWRHSPFIDSFAASGEALVSRGDDGTSTDARLASCGDQALAGRACALGEFISKNRRLTGQDDCNETSVAPIVALAAGQPIDPFPTPSRGAKKGSVRKGLALISIGRGRCEHEASIRSSRRTRRVGLRS
jgi:hypothetical protein